MKYSYQYYDMPEEHPAFIALSQNLDNQIQPHWAEKATQIMDVGIGFSSSPNL